MSASADVDLPSLRQLRVIEILSVLELTSLAVLLINLVIVRVDRVAALLGPIHGGLYLCVAASVMLGRNLQLRTRLLSPIPLIGGGLAINCVRTERRRARGWVLPT